MTIIAFFGHDVLNGNIRRRVHTLREDGLKVQGFMFRRGEASGAAEWPNVHLGTTHDRALLRRLKSVAQGVWTTIANRQRLRPAEVILARNLDMLAIALVSRGLLRLSTPVIYECLDIHRSLAREDIIGSAFRRMEGVMLGRCALVVVSSPGFLESHFEPRHTGRYRARLIENRLASSEVGGPRPKPRLSAPSEPLRLGWFGNIRCERSLSVICDMADRFGKQLEIDIQGFTTESAVPDFFQQIDARPNIHFGGRYRIPQDFDRIYGSVDLAWAGDFYDAGFNSQWLLANRLHESGFHTVPPIAPAGTQSAKWVLSHGCGFVVEDPVEVGFPRLIEELINDRSRLMATKQALAALDDCVFLRTQGELAGVIAEALALAENEV